MTAKEYLLQIRAYEIRIRQIETEIRRNEVALLPGAIRYDRDRVQTTPEDKFAEIMASVGDLILEQRRKVAELARLRDRIIDEISQVKGIGRSQVLYMRYVAGMRYEAIAYALNYSVDHVKRLHSRGLKEFERRVIRKQ